MIQPQMTSLRRYVNIWQMGNRLSTSVKQRLLRLWVSQTNEDAADHSAYLQVICVAVVQSIVKLLSASRNTEKQKDYGPKELKNSILAN